MIVQACLNGARAPDYHPRLPVSIEALVADGRAGVTAGAAELHLHVRGPEGVEEDASERRIQCSSIVPSSGRKETFTPADPTLRPCHSTCGRMTPLRGSSGLRALCDAFFCPLGTQVEAEHGWW